MCEQSECKCKKQSKYPDLDHMEDVLLANIIKNHPEFDEKIKMCDTSAEMFPQTWGSTAGGFEEPGMIAGCAMTTTYTTVMKVRLFVEKKMKPFDFYGVFFGNEPAYLVTDPPKIFFDDLKTRRMKSKYEAKSAY